MNPNLEKQLKNYSALSAGVFTSLSLSSQVVVTDVLHEGAQNTIYNVDIDNNGTYDFRFIHEYQTYGMCCSKNLLSIEGFSYNQILIGSTSNFAYRLDSLYSIDNGNFMNDAILFGIYNSYSLTVVKGFFISSCDKYIGVKFDKNGNTHNGWIRISTNSSSSGVIYFIHSWAYEIQPNTPTITPSIINKYATNVVATDIGNNGDASDIQITFDGAEDEYDIQNQGRYKIFLSKSFPDFYSSPNFYEVVMNGSATYVVNLPNNFKDADGNAIDINTQYDVYVFTVYSCAIYLSNIETISINGVVGLEEQFSTPLSMTVYPNPATNEANIKSEQPITSVEIRDVSGKLVLESTNHTIDVSNLSEGIYYVKAQFFNGSSAYEKLVVTK
ncbi:MAG: T9SS type A sorting domain-containing protein [Bacteroidia bacterium]